MKLHTKILSLLFLALMGCSTGYHAANQVDDIYYTPQVVRPGSDQDITYSDATVVEVPKETYNTESNTQAYNGNQHGADSGYTNQDAEYNSDSLSYSTSGNMSESFYDDEGNVYISNYYGNVYDYAYSSRIRRFYRPMLSSSYYDPFYTNMYWYNYDPFYSGVSIYMGHGSMPFYYPGYYWNPAFSWRMNYGLGYGYDPFSWYYDPFAYNYGYSPYRYSPYSFHSAYRYGFSSGYYLGYYNNPYNYQYLYNSYDPSNYHYGHRGSIGGSTGMRNAGSSASFAERFETSTVRNASGLRETVSRAGGRISDNEKSNENAETRPQRRGLSPDQTISQPGTTTGRAGRQTEQINDRNEGSLSATDRGVKSQDSGSQNRSATPGRTSAGTLQRPDATRTTGSSATNRPQTSQAPTTARPTNTTATPPQRYTRPEQAAPANQPGENQPNYSPPRTYTSPSYMQPRSNEQFRSPQTTRTPAVTPPREARPPASIQRTTPEQRNVQPQVRPQTTPTRQDRGQPSYSPPPQRTPTRTQPAASPASRPATTAPASRPSSSPRSTPSVSPSRSPSSSPSRSSGSSTPSRSSSGRSRR